MREEIGGGIGEKVNKPRNDPIARVSKTGGEETKLTGDPGLGLSTLAWDETSTFGRTLRAGEGRSPGVGQALRSKSQAMVKPQGPKSKTRGGL